ncbi:MAG: disulfide bond formation protein DsbC [Gammaproteobacteria bacterium HGW-Gammaproteobacteria-10]|nr:MAG: disulfide bond formation protein DsbC [Gammaproteobacteria bacterium HGW-Gammaproteobacteria-3]PKM34872.1 MAG: disulfide bond formation protein DsbC [Gammaproteobacteria bacterium HGW-Gammaproteobacteria-10]
MKQLLKSVVIAGLAFGVSAVYADESAVKQALQKSMPSVKLDSIAPSEIKGLYEVVIGSTLFYMSEDGKYLVQGRIVDIEAKKDLTEAKMAAVRKNAIDSVGVNNMIVFTPKTEQYKVSVFTDIDCAYCRKLHSEIDQYMAEGITIQYLFFPRAGKGSDSYKKAVSVWCADDRKAALTAAKKGSTPEAKTCINPVDAHMKLGMDFEARGTPMIVTEKGTIYPGYLPAKQLLEVLKEEQSF